jgi:Kdo2-lipid IVA lauroyltransferase/acyltransferase
LLLNKKNIYTILLHWVSKLNSSRKGIFVGTIAFVLHRVIRYRKKTIKENLVSAFKGGVGLNISNITINYYKNLAAYLIESVQAYELPLDELQQKIRYKNPQVLDELAQKHGKVILLINHLGNWELSSILLPSHISTASFAIYKPLSNQILDILIKEKRSRFGLTLLPMASVARHMAKSTDASIYIFAADQSPAQEFNGQWHQFLHQDTLFYDGAEVLYKKYKTGVAYQQITREQDHYTVEYKVVEGDHIIEKYVQLLQADIVSHPSDWLWSHRRWKHKKQNQSSK